MSAPTSAPAIPSKRYKDLELADVGVIGRFAHTGHSRWATMPNPPKNASAVKLDKSPRCVRLSGSNVSRRYIDCLFDLENCVTEILHPAAPDHLPGFIAAPGDTDILMVVVGIVLIGAVLGVGNLRSCPK
jgi:hypothetical protein